MLAMPVDCLVSADVMTELIRLVLLIWSLQRCCWIRQFRSCCQNDRLPTLMDRPPAARLARRWLIIGKSRGRPLPLVNHGRRSCARPPFNLAFLRQIRARTFVRGTALTRISTAKKKRPPARMRESDLLAQAIDHAVGCQGQGMWAEAETLYERILKVRPNHFDALHLLGVLRHQQGRSDEALRLFASALKVLPTSADALSNRGVAL